jgi:hypothetical protein
MVEVIDMSGHNGGPPLDPFAAHEIAILDLFELASTNMPDKVKNDAQAAQIAEMVDNSKLEKKALEETRVKEKKQYDDGKAAIQARVKPLDARLDLLIAQGRTKLTPYYKAQEDERNRIAAAKRLEADRKEQEALNKFRASQPTDLEERFEAEELAIEAKRANALANRIDKQASGMRSYWTVNVVDYGLLLKHIKLTDAETLYAMLAEYVRDKKNSGIRTLPGVEFIEERRAI